MANEHLGILPTGLSAEDFTYGGWQTTIDGFVGSAALAWSWTI